MEIGKIFLKYRKKIGYSLVQMGEKIGYSKSQISYVEKTNKASEKIIKRFLENIKEINEKEKTFLLSNAKRKTKTKKINKKNIKYEKAYKEIKKKTKLTLPKNIKKHYTKEQLKEYEQEIIETYDLMRNEKNVFSKIASVNRELINLNKMLEESFLKLDLLIEEEDEFFKRKIRRPLQTTIKNLTIKTEKLKNIVNTITIQEKKETKMDISNLITSVPLSQFTREQKRSCILMWVGLNMKFKLKQYNKVGQPTGYSTRLWAFGRESGTHTKMSNKIKENIVLNLGSAADVEEMKEIMNEISDGIIENAMIVTEDLIREARNAKTESVRRKYLKAMNNPEYLKVAFIISTMYYAKYLIDNGQDIKHVFLTSRIKALDARKNELNNIWKEYAKSDKDEEAYLQARQATEEIFLMYEKETIVQNDEIEKLADERLVYKLMGEKNVNTLIEIIADELREKLTGEIKLFPINEE